MIQFSTENVADAATLSGGSWLAGLPLANLQQVNLNYVARSADVLAASTRIDIDLGNATTVVRLVGLMRHTISTAGTYRITAGTSSGGSDVYDSGTLDVWPRIYQYDDLPFEAPNWWTGQISDDEAALYPIKLLHDAGANYLARYWRIQITDTANAAGYVEVARLWMGELWSPQRNYTFGAGLMWEPRDRAEVSRSGVRYAERRPPARVFTCEFDALGDSEAFGRFLDAQRRLGSEGQMVAIPDPDDTARRHRRDILARVRRNAPLVQFAHELQSTSLELEEVL